jgi:hypothetical protein
VAAGPGEAGAQAAMFPAPSTARNWIR